MVKKRSKEVAAPVQWFPPVSVANWKKRYPELPWDKASCKWCGFVFKDVTPWVQGATVGFTTEACAGCSGGAMTAALGWEAPDAYYELTGQPLPKKKAKRPVLVPINGKEDS